MNQQPNQIKIKASDKKLKGETDEFSFILKPSKVCDGVGVFATHGIASGTRLRVFGEQIEDDVDRARIFDKNALPEIFHGYCVDDGEKFLCPADFGSMPIGWHINHSEAPNAYQKNRKWYYAARDIIEGEEILIDYNSLGEPMESREDFYKV